MKEYHTTYGPRKSWDGEPDLTKEGWTETGWERLDYHEERYWEREVQGKEEAQVREGEKISAADRERLKAIEGDARLLKSWRKYELNFEAIADDIRWMLALIEQLEASDEQAE